MQPRTRIRARRPPRYHRHRGPDQGFHDRTTLRREDRTNQRGRAFHAFWLARTRLDQGKLDQACHTATQALEPRRRWPPSECQAISGSSMTSWPRTDKSP
ncbi:hypothetical protein GCM10010307_65270 [Streptomyces vastus]|uniref:Tetratricopeptide repeat protein n=1 Tax=Streptomyces vastus TaxID=285451 RepID=A0ABN3RJ69_9ACTN